jgi:Ca2+-binding EF-hand superfamily protein
MLTFVLALAFQTVPVPAPTPVPTPAPQTAPQTAPEPAVSPEAEDENEFFALFDTDKAGAITKAEFDGVSARIDAEAAAQDPSQKGQVAAGLATAFALLDQNKDGKITREEFRAVTAKAK